MKILRLALLALLPALTLTLAGCGDDTSASIDMATPPVTHDMATPQHGG